MTNQTRRPRGQAASVTQGRSALLDNAPKNYQSISEDEEFAVMNRDRMVEHHGLPVDGEGDGVTNANYGNGGGVTHKTAGLVMMWKPTDNGWMAVEVTSTSIEQVLRAGWKSYCPDCNGRHGAGPNDCPGRQPVAYRICPICPAVIWDNYQVGTRLPTDEQSGDPNMIVDEAYTNSTPATRTKAALDLHLWTRHPQETRAMGIPPLPEPSTTVMESALTGAPGVGHVAGGGELL